MQIRSIRSAGLLATLSTAVITLVWAAFPTDPPNDPRWAQENGQNVVCSPTPQSPLCGKPYGQWNLKSNKSNTANPLPHASGISADLAWQTEVGRPDVVVVVLDSGVNYDHQDLRNKIWLNCGELPAPNNAGATAAGSSPDCLNAALVYDLNGDGIVNIEDYQNDSRVSLPLISPLGANKIAVTDIRKAFADGIDNEGNGFPDDLSGWDADDANGDEYSATRDGHGTGRNGFIAAQTNNSAGIAGICPECRLANVRVDDTFVTRSEGTGIGAIWAADHGHEVINMALGATSASTFTRAAFDYAWQHNVLAVSATANEFSFHQNFQTVFDDVLGIGGVVPDNDLVANCPPGSPQPQCTDTQYAASPAPTTYLRKANFSNFGAHIDVVAPSDSPTTGFGTTSYGDSSGTSSSVPHASGVAALIFSRGRNALNFSAFPQDGRHNDISALEVKMVMRITADDIVRADDPGSADQYPTIGAGWDKYTGYGRINADKAVDRISATTMPPEADINSPDWYSYVDGTVPVRFYANARWATGFTWVLEYGAGVQPATFTQITASGGNSDPALSSVDMVDNFTSTWNTTALANGAYTLRLRVTDTRTPANSSEDRMTVWVRHPDAQDFTAAWPKQMGRTVAGRFYPVSLESISVSLVDLDNDNDLEIIFASADGEVHALNHDGTALPGFPVRGDRMPGIPAGANGFACDATAPSDAFDCNEANGEVPITAASGIAGVIVGDMDRDVVQEICGGSYDGKFYCWNADGTRQPGFPVQADPFSTFDSTDVETPTSKPEPVHAATFYDLDGDGKLEIIAGGFDQKLYVWKSDGTNFANFPMLLADTAGCGAFNPKNPSEIISGPLAGDIDKDGKPEIVAATTEKCDSPNSNSVPGSGSGRVYALKADSSGNWVLMSGWPIKPVGLNICPVPLVACGVGHGVTAADVDDNGDLELAMGVFLGGPYLYEHTGAARLTFASNPAGVGPGGDVNEETPEGGLGRQEDPALAYVALGALANFNTADAAPEYLTGTLGAQVASLALGSGKLALFDHYVNAWSTSGPNAGAPIPQFPRVMDDWQFFTGPALADISGDTNPEAISGSGGYFLYAFNSSGAQPAGWPKRLGQWMVSTPSVADLDNDGKMEVVAMTRFGSVHLYKSAGAACQPEKSVWRKARHNEWNTGVLGHDTLRPAKVTDLTASRVGAAVNLNWTAVGDDGLCGAAANYEMVVSPSPITTTAAFDDPTLTRRNLPGVGSRFPMSASQSETAARYYTLRVADEMGNRSPMASVLVAAAPQVTGTGAVVITQTGSPAGDLGTTVTAGSFTLTHTAPATEAHQVSQLTLLLSDATVFGSITLTAPGGRTATVTAPSSSAAFNFDPALQIAPGATASFTVTAQLAASATAAVSPSWLNSAYAGADPAVSAATAGYALLLLLSAMWFLPRRLAVATLLAIGMLAGCSSDRGGTTPAVTQTRTSTVVINTIGAATTSGGTVTYTGLPATLGTVTLRY